MKQQEEVNYSCGCSHWFIRFLTWATTAAAFGLSLAALDTCNLILGRAIFYNVPDKDVSAEDLIEANATAQGLPEPRDPLTDPFRARPGYNTIQEFSLGAYKASESGSPISWVGCLPYDNGYAEQYMSAGAAEGSARFFGTLAAALGGLAMVAFFALALMEVSRPLVFRMLAGILVTAAFCQILIFSLNSSKHCTNQFWNDFLSRRTQLLTQTAGVSCELGDDGWFAVIAFILYLFAALLVTLKWSNPTLSVFQMDWTTEGKFPKRRGGGPRRLKKRPKHSSDEEKAQKSLHPQVPPTMDNIQKEMQPLVHKKGRQEHIPVPTPAQEEYQYDYGSPQVQYHEETAQYQEETVQYQEETVQYQEESVESEEQYYHRPAASDPVTTIQEQGQRSNSPTLIRASDDEESAPSNRSGRADPPTAEDLRFAI